MHPKRILSKATPTDLQLLSSKAADEGKALTLCRGKVAQKGLEMEITDAEWQFGRLISYKQDDYFADMANRPPQVNAVLYSRKKNRLVSANVASSFKCSRLRLAAANWLENCFASTRPGSGYRPWSGKLKA